MSFILIAIVLLFLPGFTIAYLAGLKKYRYLLSFSLSYSVFALLLKTVRMTGQNIQFFTYAYAMLIFSLCALSLYKFYKINNYKKINPEIRCCGCTYNWFIPTVIIVISIVVYFLIFGAYIEVPSDVLQHFEYIQWSARDISRSVLTGVPIQGHFGVNGKFWSYLYSLISYWNGVSPASSMLVASVFNVSAFLLGVFWFSTVVFNEMQPASRTLIVTSVAAAFFTFFHFGVNIFAFIRYYALAPVMLNMILYFSVMAIAIDFFREKKWGFKYLIVGSIIFYTSLLIHRQEALFAVLMVCIMSFYLFIQKHAANVKLLWRGEARLIAIAPIKFVTDKVNISFFLTQSVLVSLFIYSYTSISRHPVKEPKVIPLENIFPFFKNLYISNPTYQFYYVVTLWGAAVIILFVLNIKKFKNNAFLMAGMLSPFFTLFNPFFVDLFLRHTYSVMLWRMSLLVPLQLVGAYLLIDALQKFPRKGYLIKAYTILVVIMLVTFLFPFKTTFIENNYSRLLTLKSVPVENSPAQWDDLLGYLNGLDQAKRIITDPVTGYTITAFTKHISSRAKFHRAWGRYIKFNYKDYSHNPFDRYQGFLFIINKRNGGMSETGRKARHWPEGILQIEKYYYSENMEDYISSNPGRFKLLWEKNKIRVYSLDVPRR